jgi:hypothetical protein
MAWLRDELQATTRNFLKSMELILVEQMVVE